MRSQSFRNPLRFGNFYRLRLDLIFFCFVVSVVALLACPFAHAQGGVPLVTVVSDQSSLPLSNQFGIPSATAINQAGDFAFIGSGGSALFFRSVGAASAALLLQNGDVVPGFPTSVIRSFSPFLGLSLSRSLLFAVTFSFPDGSQHAVVLLFDGSDYRAVASSDNIAPGSNGATYGMRLTPGSINDNGDLDFSAVLTGESAVTYYIVPSGGAAVRVVGIGDTPPAACTWCSISETVTTTGFSPPPNLNSRGQMVVNLDGGLFIGSQHGLQLVMMPSSGACSPAFPNVFPLTGNGIPVNALGMVAFGTESISDSGSNVGSIVGGAVCVSTGGGTAVPVVSFGDAAPAAIGGTFGTFFVLGLDDSGDILLMAQISGGNTPYALLRYHSFSVPAGVLDVVAYNGEVLPAPDGSTFASPTTTVPGTPPTTFPRPAFLSSSIANNGLVTFNVRLAPSGEAVYQQAGAGVPVRVALSGQTSPPSGGGTLDLSAVFQTPTLNTGATFLASTINNGSASFGEFLVTTTSVQALMTTADVLPPSARTTFTGAPPTATANFIAFMAQIAGGGSSLFVSNLISGAITRVAGEGDPAILNVPGISGAPILTPSFFVNSGGQVAFEVATRNGSLILTSETSTGVPASVTSPWSALPGGTCGTIFLWSPSSGVTKIVAPGDAAPGAGNTFSCVSLNNGQLSPLNASGQVTFNGTLSVLDLPQGFLNACGPGFFPPGNNVFVYTPGSGISELAATDSLLAGSSSPIDVIPNLASPINSSGQVAFGAGSGSCVSSAGYFQGFFLNIMGGTLSELVGAGALLPGSTDTIASLNFISGLDDNGDLAFTSSTTNATDGLFLAPLIGNIQTIALDGGTAPGGGKFSLVTPVTVNGFTSDKFSNFALMNNEADVAFRSGINGGAGDSGYFRLMHGGPNVGAVQQVAIQGQLVPSGIPFTFPVGSGLLNTIPSPGDQGSSSALGPDGSLAFVNGFTSASTSLQGMFVAQPAGSILKVLASGDTAPGGGAVTGLSMSQGLAAGAAGKFAFWAGIQGGIPRQAIFVTAISAGAAFTATSGGYSRSSTVFGQQISLMANVVSTANGSPTGSVNFFDSGIFLGTSALSGGQAILNISTLATGTHSITTQYTGDANFAPSISSAVALGIGPRTTTTTLAASSSSIVDGQSVTLTATVATSAGGSPTGTVTFLDAAAVIGTSTLNGGGTATLATTALGVASHSITAQYGGDVNSAASTSSNVTESVNLAGFAPPPANSIVTAGQTLPILLTLYGAPGSNLSFMLSCSGLPVGTTCAFGSNPVTAAVPPNGTTVQLMFVTTAGAKLLPVDRRRWPSPLSTPGLIAVVLSVLMVSVIGLRRTSRRRLALGLSFVVLMAATLMLGCSAGNSASAPPGTPKGSAAFTVTGTSGATTVTTVISVTVQ